jgi:hypothetical protein
MSDDENSSRGDEVHEYESDFDVPPDTTARDARDALVSAIENRATMTLPSKKTLLQRLRDAIFDEDFAPPAPNAASAASAAAASDDAVVSRGFVITLRSCFPASKIENLQAGAVSEFLLKIHERLSTTYGDERPKYFTRRSLPFSDLDALVVKAKDKAKATLETDAAKKDKGPVGYKEVRTFSNSTQSRFNRNSLSWQPPHSQVTPTGTSSSSSLSSSSLSSSSSSAPASISHAPNQPQARLHELVKALKKRAMSDALAADKTDEGKELKRARLQLVKDLDEKGGSQYSVVSSYLDAMDDLTDSDAWALLVD